ncbi:putative efflux transporter [Mycena vitilis]|nr:putative efflux transporter [Mycena vitilis]
MQTAHAASGTLLTSTGALLLALIRPPAPYWAFGFPSPIVAVFGADFVFAAGTLFVAKVARGEEQSLAGGLFQTLTQLGTAFGLAVTTIVHNAVADRHPNLRGAEGQGAPLEAYRAAQWTAFGMGVLCTLLAAGFLRGVGPVGVHGPPPDQEAVKLQVRKEGQREGEKC